MGKKYLIDSNAVIEFLGGILPSIASNQIQNIIDLNSHYISDFDKIHGLKVINSHDW